MEKPPYDQIIQDSTFGYTYNKILFDERGMPIDYVFLEVNPAYERMIGMEVGSVAGKRVTEVLPAIRTESFDWIECFARVAMTGERMEFEEYTHSLDRWFHLSLSSPSRGYFVGLSFDITERKKYEERLRKSEERNRLYVENAPDGIFITDKDLRYIDVNEAGCRMLGYTKEELLALEVKNVAVVQEEGYLDRYMGELFENGYIRRSGNLRKKDGSLIHVILDSIVMEGNKTLSFCKDTTEQARLEAEKNQYYSAFQTTPQPILITDPSGVIVSVNGSFLELYGFERDELIGKNPHVLNPGREVYENLGVSVFEYDSTFGELWAAVKDPRVRSWRGELINRKKNGTLVWVNLLVNGVYDERGRLTSIVGLPIDMTVSHEVAMRSRVQLYQTIADLAELRDDDTGNHMKRVGLFAKMLAREYGMNQKYCEDIEVFAPMHDIGKVGILDSILRAPRKLTPEEFEIMKTHTLLGYNIIKGKEEFEMAAAITLHHHERFDGTGYPHGLEGKKHTALGADHGDSGRLRRLAEQTPLQGTLDARGHGRPDSERVGIAFRPRPHPTFLPPQRAVRGRLQRAEGLGSLRAKLERPAAA